MWFSLTDACTESSESGSVSAPVVHVAGRELAGLFLGLMLDE